MEALQEQEVSVCVGYALCMNYDLILMNFLTNNLTYNSIIPC